MLGRQRSTQRPLLPPAPTFTSSFLQRPSLSLGEGNTDVSFLTGHSVIYSHSDQSRVSAVTAEHLAKRLLSPKPAAALNVWAQTQLLRGPFDSNTICSQ